MKHCFADVSRITIETRESNTVILFTTMVKIFKLKPLVLKFILCVLNRKTLFNNCYKIMNEIRPQMERKMDSSSTRKSSKFIGFLGTAQT